MWECGSGKREVKKYESAVRESEKYGIGQTPSIGVSGAGSHRETLGDPTSERWRVWKWSLGRSLDRPLCT